MPSVVTAAEMQALDARAIDTFGVPGGVLMERAALACADHVTSWRRSPGRAVALVGPGNNGGDGAAIARLLHLRGWRVTIALAAERDRIRGDAAAHLDAAEAVGVPVLPCEHSDVLAQASEAHLWVDALLGVGATEAPRGRIARLLEALSHLPRPDRVLAVDLPTGVLSDTGTCPGAVLPADVTITFQCRKWGTVLPPGSVACGRLQVVDIGIPLRDEALDRGLAQWFDASRASAVWTPPPAGAHKGIRGHALVIAGDDRTLGAAILASEACLRAGAGLVTAASSGGVHAALAARRPEIMWTPRGTIAGGIDARYGAVLLGPGIGVDDAGEALLDATLEHVGDRPLVLDADALTLIGARDPRPLPPRTVLTPHPGELGRLLGCRTSDVTADLLGAARACADRWGAVVVAKTAGALVVGGDVRFVAPGHPGMGTAGSGDVLAGVITALALRHNPEDAASLGAWIHARAGAAAGERRGGESLVAGDIIDHLGDAFVALAGA